MADGPPTPAPAPPAVWPGLPAPPMGRPSASAARAARTVALVVGVAALTVATGAALHATLAAHDERERARAAAPGASAGPLALPPASVLRWLGFGHHEMLADLVAARANVYFGGQPAAHGGAEALEQALTTAVDLDPHFHRLYLRGAAMLVYTGQTITVTALLSANRLLERGARVFPGDWELPFQRGFNLFFELPKLVGEDDPRTPDFRQAGVEALRQAAALDGAPAWLPGLVARMLTREGGEELALHHLERTYALTNSAATRAEIARRLGALRGQGRSAALERARNELERDTAARYPYAPEAFSIIAGPRRFGAAPGRGETSP